MAKLGIKMDSDYGNLTFMLGRDEYYGKYFYEIDERTAAMLALSREEFAAGIRLPLPAGSTPTTTITVNGITQELLIPLWMESHLLFEVDDDGNLGGRLFVPAPFLGQDKYIGIGYLQDQGFMIGITSGPNIFGQDDNR